MRVRPQRPTERRSAQRRPHILAHHHGADVAAAAASAPAIAEHRHRAAGPPEDRATYGCACGCVFAAPVSTTVACPNCGSPQAW